MFRFFGLIVVAMCLLSSCQSDGDRLLVEVPRGDMFVDMNLTSVHATSSQNLIVGGFLTTVDDEIEGILLRTSDGGLSWRRIGSMTFPFRGFLPQTVYFNDLLRGWVSGIRIRDGQTIPSVLRTDDGGGHWRETLIPENRAAIVLGATELLFESDEVGVVQVAYQDLKTGLPRVNLYETRDGGRNWVLGQFMDAEQPKISDTGRFFFTEKEGFRLDDKLANGTQVLQYTASGGEIWVPQSQFHLSQFPQYY